MVHIQKKKKNLKKIKGHLLSTRDFLSPGSPLGLGKFCPGLLTALGPPARLFIPSFNKHTLSLMLGQS